MDDYQTLGIPHGASLEEARRAWRSLVRISHPDAVHDAAAKAAATARLASINAALDRIASGKPQTSPGEARRSAGKRTNHRPRSSAARPDTEPKGPNVSSKSTDADIANFFKAIRRRTEPRKPQPQSQPKPHPQAQAQPQPQPKPQPKPQFQDRQTSGYATKDRKTPTTEFQLAPSEIQKAAMRELLDRKKKQEAFKKVIEMDGVYPDPRKPINTDRSDLPAFHAVDVVSIKAKNVEVHLKSRAKIGRNIIALPQLEARSGGAIRHLHKAQIVEVSANEESARYKVKAHGSIVEGSSDYDAFVVFDSKRLKTRTGQ